MASQPSIPVGVRLPLATGKLPPPRLLQVCHAALELGYTSFWAGDHVLPPEHSASPYPHSGDGSRPFTARTPWADPLLELTWLAAHLPGARFGTGVLILTLRNPALLAKQLGTMSWLTGRAFSPGIGTGWLREEYDATGMPFDKRASRAGQSIAEITELLACGQRNYHVRGDGDELVDKAFTMLPKAPAPVDFLWGGVSPAAIRLAESSCDGWLPTEQSIEALEGGIIRLKAVCDNAGRDFRGLKLIVKPGPGPDPRSGEIDKDNLAGYAELGFHEVILEMPFNPDGVSDAVRTLERVAARSWL